MPTKRKADKKIKLHIIFCKLLISLLLIFFISLSYFLILISIEPKSFPFVTKEVESYINSNLSYKNNLKINHALLSFHHFHKLKITIDDISLNLNFKEKFLFPKIEAEFSIFNLLLLRYAPSKIRIIDPIIEINNISHQNQQIVINGINYQDILDQQKYLKGTWKIPAIGCLLKCP